MKWVINHEALDRRPFSWFVGLLSISYFTRFDYYVIMLCLFHVAYGLVQFFFQFENEIYKYI